MQFLAGHMVIQVLISMPAYRAAVARSVVGVAALATAVIADSVTEWVSPLGHDALPSDGNQITATSAEEMEQKPPRGRA